MNGLLPIIRRVRRPLLPVEEARPLQEPPGGARLSRADAADPGGARLSRADAADPGGERLSRADAADPVAVSVPPEPVAPSPVIKKKTHGTAAKTPDP